MDVALRFTAGEGTLVPLTETLSGEVGELEGMETEPDFAPRVDGENDTSNVQLLVGETACPLQLSLSIKKSAPTVSVPKTRMPFPVLVMVSVEAELVVPMI